MNTPNPMVFTTRYAALLCLLGGAGSLAAASADADFHVPADPSYTLVDSARDSVRFTLTKTLQSNEQHHLVSISSFVNPQGEVMGWHDFGNLEGPGWAANAVGGAWEIFAFGAFLGKADWQSNALAILDHVLEGGFVDPQTGFIKGYRETTTGKFCLNYKHNSDWFCPGSMAKIGYQLLRFSEELGSDPVRPAERDGEGIAPGARKPGRAKRMRLAAVLCADWIQRNVEPVPNGWYPRRTDPSGRVYRKSPDGGDDRFWQTSADSLFILQLQAALTRAGLADYRANLRDKAAVFIRAGGIFGSINHDTYDPNENVAYSVAFRTLLLVGEVLKDSRIREFALENCLAGLDQFKMCEDRNGVATRGLLFMERSWDTAYLWENAEAALALFEAAKYQRQMKPRGDKSDADSRWERDGLVILRAIARHHYGPHGFLTEGVDWNDHVGQQHHIDGKKFAAIQYTEPFLNNQHIVEPTLFYLQNLAAKRRLNSKVEWRDLEGNRLLIW